jgi:hypothetical protein
MFESIAPESVGLALCRLKFDTVGPKLHWRKHW